MDNKYYLPKDEDFTEGLEFEYQYYNEEDDKYEDTWYKTTFDIRGGLGHDMYHQLNEGTIRVKYLDSFDIESFGLKEDSRYKFVDYEQAFKIDYQVDFKSLIINVNYINNKIHICYGNLNNAITNTRFIGIIKNKTKLKEVLNMIGIYE